MLSPLHKTYANSKSNFYCYIVLGEITKCASPNGLQRSWTHHFKWTPCIGICVLCLKIYDIELGSVMLPWDFCTYILLYLETLGSMPFFLGSMYFLGKHVTALGSMTVHQAMTGMPHHHSCHIDYSKIAP
jgi:hypothetical protein